MRTLDAVDDPVYAVGGDGVAWRETSGSIVVLDIVGSVYFGLNGSGAGLWKRLVAAGATRAELTALLLSGAPGQAQRAAADVDRFLAQLDSFGLLHRV